ncbi:hypothetical protein SAMN05421821_101320 [Mucilaginibacter lappiensis]|uniref:Transposase n=1 Tax=Mucilaginibacter lappiensis TaxID=354630 RepID=A0ABR6PDJ1_9SPHI|nr:hypothetical protein [Mucilaginibacter lappiensis]MBB6107766.1 hypothetical protein [Mucilaginibacter lappiensis]SIP97838.1 hypothetical protein SAMN05421821_101320 [Mucilaginibacter lappiensis]
MNFSKSAKVAIFKILAHQWERIFNDRQKYDPPILKVRNASKRPHIRLPAGIKD